MTPKQPAKMTRRKSCRCGGTKDKGWHLVCAPCWAKVPPVLQGEVYEAYREQDGSPRHLTAIRNVFRALGPISQQVTP